MLTKTNISQSGFALLEGVLISIFICGVVAIGVLVYRGRSSLTAKNHATPTNSIAVKPQVAATDLTPNDVAKLQATQPTSTPASTPSTTTTNTTNTPTAKTQTTTAAHNPTTPAPQPTPTPPLAATITISTDGCMITATGTPGMALEVGAFTPRKGGSTTFTLPASGTKTTSAGGVQGMTSYGQLTDASGNKVAYNSSTITPVSCPPAG